LGGLLRVRILQRTSIKTMAYPHRIAAGGIIIKDNSVLLVKYHDERDEETYFVGPGGALLDNEDIIQAIIRETMEETGIVVKPNRVIIIEDIISSRYKDMNICKMIKIWMLCNYIEGKIQRTTEAEEEGIIEAGWFTRDQLKDKKVYPSTLLDYNWNDIQDESWRIKILSSRSG
jgi:8-oxo-dGTP pyrophosphatase MutT (NUDIX family)